MHHSFCSGLRQVLSIIEPLSVATVSPSPCGTWDDGETMGFPHTYYSHLVSSHAIWLLDYRELSTINHLPAKVSDINFHPLEVVSRYRDPQLQVGENTHMCLIRDQTGFHGKTHISFPSTLSSLNLPLSSPSTKSRKLLPQFLTCSGWRWFDVV